MKPKFTLRDLFWLMLVVGLATGWYLEWRRLKVNRFNVYKVYGFDAAAAKLKNEMGIVMTVDQHGVTMTYPSGRTRTTAFSDVQSLPLK